MAYGLRLPRSSAVGGRRLEALETLFHKVNDVVPWWVIAPIALVLFVFLMQRFFWSEETRPERRYRGPADPRPSRRSAAPVPAVTVYDRAEVHYQGKFPEGLAKGQAFVHTGMFLAWAVERGLESAEIGERAPEALDAFHARKFTGTRLYHALGGVFDSDLLSEDGNVFAASYFDFETGQFLEDYAQTLAGGLESLYHVDDSWENYDTLCAVLDRRFLAWQRSRA